MGRWIFCSHLVCSLKQNLSTNIRKGNVLGNAFITKIAKNVESWTTFNNSSSSESCQILTQVRSMKSLVSLTQTVTLLPAGSPYHCSTINSLSLSWCAVQSTVVPSWELGYKWSFAIGLRGCGRQVNGAPLETVPAACHPSVPAAVCKGLLLSLFSMAYFWPVCQFLY